MTPMEVVHPPALSLPRWPSEPGPVDADGRSHLVVAIGPDPEVARVSGGWVRAAEALAPTTLAVLDTMSDPIDRATLADALERAHTGVRVMITGGQYDVLQALAFARNVGLLPQELTSFAAHTRDLPLYCAHCRETHRVEGEPGGEVTCPGCDRHLEIHAHLSAARGSFLASDARARELAR